MKHRKLGIALGVLFFVVALGVTLYPLIAANYNEKHQSELHTSYDAEISQVEDASLREAREAASAYNADISALSLIYPYSQDVLDRAEIDYADLLDLTGGGIMAYIRIPKLDLSLPVYHGTNELTLEKGIGHLLGSTLPIGGEDTHAVLTGHSGLSSQPMFSNLADLVIGDIFYIDVLGETLAYEVDQIETVLPTDSTYLGVEKGRDLVTLVTCTPFGVNTHRLLVRGTRVEIPQESADEPTPTETLETDTWTQKYIDGILLGVEIAGAILVIGGAVLVICKLRKRGRHEKK